MWIKYRLKDASGMVADWDWEFYDTEDLARMNTLAKELVEEQSEPYRDDELFRGVEWGIVAEAPKEIVKRHIKKTENTLKWATLRLTSLRSQLK